MQRRPKTCFYTKAKGANDAIYFQRLLASGEVHKWLKEELFNE